MGREDINVHAKVRSLVDLIPASFKPLSIKFRPATIVVSESKKAIDFEKKFFSTLER
jgi:hypothetical protein